MVLDDLPDGHLAPMSEALRAAARWVLEAASGSGYAVAVTVIRDGQIHRTRPGRGRSVLRRALALVDGATVLEDSGALSSSATPSPARLTDALEGLTPGAAVIVSPFDVRPAEAAALTDAVHSVGRRTTLIPVRVQTADLDNGADLLPVGLVEVRDCRGVLRAVDASDARVREAWRAGLQARAHFLSQLEDAMSAGVQLRPDDRSLAPLIHRFGGRGSGRRTRSQGGAGAGAVAGGRAVAGPVAAAGALAGAAVRAIAIAMLLTAAVLGIDPAPLDAQTDPGRTEILEDRLAESGKVGTPLRRTLRVRWAGGPASNVRLVTQGEQVDVQLHAAGQGDDPLADEWIVEVDYTYWELGEHRLPLVTLAGRDPQTPLEIRPRRIRLEAPAAPASGLAPTLPALPRGLLPWWARWVPIALGLAGMVALLGVRARGMVQGGAQLLRHLRGHPTTEPADPLDRVMARVRRQLEERAGPHPGWTGTVWHRWSETELPIGAARILAEIRSQVDERRFRASPPSTSEIQTAEELAGRLAAAMGDAA